MEGIRDTRHCSALPLSDFHLIISALPLSYEKKYRFYFSFYVYFTLILLNIAADVKQANESEDRSIPPVPVAIITFAPLD